MNQLQPYQNRADNSAKTAEDFINLTEVIQAIRRRFWLIAIPALIGGVAAAVYVFQEVPLYQARAAVRLGAARAAVMSGIEAPTADPDRYVNPMLSYMQLFRSRTLLGEVVDSVGYRLRPDYGQFPARLIESARVARSSPADTLWLTFSPSWYTIRTQRAERRADYGETATVDGVSLVISGPPSAESLEWTVTPREQAIDRMLANLRISPRTETNVVDVTFSHPNPGMAMNIVNTLVTRYQSFEAQFAQELSRRRRIFLEEQLTQTDSSLAQAQRDLTAYQTRTQSYDARQALLAQQQNRMLLDIRREELDADRRMLQTLIDQLDVVAAEERWEAMRTLVSAPAIAANPVVSRIYDQLLQYRTGLDSLTLGLFGDASTNPDVQRQRQLIAAAEEELASAIRSHVASMDARSAALEELAVRTADEMAALPPQLAEEDRLGQLVETYQKVADQLREEYQKARMSEAVSIGQADIIDMAAMPYEPISGMKKVKLALGVLLGLALGGAAAIVLEHRDRSIHRREDVEAQLHLPLIGVIPRAAGPALAAAIGRLSGNDQIPTDGGNADGDVLRPSHQTRRRLLRRTLKGLLPGSGEPPATTQPVTQDTDALHTLEAYRMLRTNFLFAQWAKNVRSVVITSAVPQEGKTLTAVNLAASIAEEGRRVLLIDGDLWQGRIHEMAVTAESPGLAELLAGDCSAADVIRETSTPGLFLITRGGRHANPSSLTRHAALRTLLDESADDFDVVVVDAPPIMATAGGPALCAVADGVLLVVRAGSTEKDAVQHALQQLQVVGANVLGAVLNDPSSKMVTVEHKYHYMYAKT